MKLYEIPENKDVKLYIDGKTIIFGHLDGMYSYCWLKEDNNKLIHINACTEFRKFRDGYKLVGDTNVKD